MILQFYCITFLLLLTHFLLDGLGFFPPPSPLRPPHIFLIYCHYLVFCFNFLQCCIYKSVKLVKEKLYL